MIFQIIRAKDVIRGPFPAEDRALFGLNHWGLLFLWTNWLAFSMGLGVTACVQIINSRAGYSEGRQGYLKAVESMLLPMEIMTLVSSMSEKWTFLAGVFGQLLHVLCGTQTNSQHGNTSLF